MTNLSKLNPRPIHSALQRIPTPLRGNNGKDVERECFSTLIAGGDSGGPSFVNSPSGDLLFGVHARSSSTCLAGRPMGTNCDDNSWTWISSTPRSADAPIAPIWDDLRSYIGAYVSPTRLVSNDFNNNGLGDVLWHNASTGETQIWFMGANWRTVLRRATVDATRDGGGAMVGAPWSMMNH
jgi:hypothetical protein